MKERPFEQWMWNLAHPGFFDRNSRLERGDPVEVVTELKAETDGTLEVAGRDPSRPDRSGRTCGRVSNRGRSRGHRRRNAVLPDAAVVELVATVGEPYLSWRYGAAAVRSEVIRGRIHGHMNANGGHGFGMMPSTIQ